MNKWVISELIRVIVELRVSPRFQPNSNFLCKIFEYTLTVPESKCTSYESVYGEKRGYYRYYRILQILQILQMSVAAINNIINVNMNINTFFVHANALGNALSGLVSEYKVTNTTRSTSSAT